MNGVTGYEIRQQAPLWEEINRLKAELAVATDWNHRVSVCAKHTGEIVDGECVICELAAAKVENETLRTEQGYTFEQCLSCGGTRGHAEGCLGTTALQILNERLAAAKAEMQKMIDNAIVYRQRIRELEADLREAG